MEREGLDALALLNFLHQLLASMMSGASPLLVASDVELRLDDQYIPYSLGMSYHSWLHNVT
jgi:hypothetical protein